jgi:hypothetical protein
VEVAKPLKYRGVRATIRSEILLWIFLDKAQELAFGALGQLDSALVVRLNLKRF